MFMHGQGGKSSLVDRTRPVGGEAAASLQSSCADPPPPPLTPTQEQAGGHWGLRGVLNIVLELAGRNGSMVLCFPTSRRQVGCGSRVVLVGKNKL